MKTKIISVVVLTTCLVSVWLPAQQSAPDLAFPADPDYLLLSFTYIHSMLENPDTTPLMQIYGDGRVHVHYPVYMQRAGDYELQLGNLELRQLLLSLAETGALDLDIQELGELHQLQKELLAQQNLLIYISDSTEMVINVHLEFYKPPGTSAQIDNFQKSVRWSNVAQEAQLFPELIELQGLAEAERQLQAILERVNLRSVED